MVPAGFPVAPAVSQSRALTRTHKNHTQGLRHRTSNWPSHVMPCISSAARYGAHRFVASLKVRCGARSGEPNHPQHLTQEDGAHLPRLVAA